MRRYIDVTLPYNRDIPAWPGEPKPEISRLKSMDRGDDANVTHIDAAVHYGTHVDAPVHFIDGAAGIDSIPTEVLIGPVTVVGLPDADIIDAAVLATSPLPAGCERVLFKPRNSGLWAEPDHPFDRGYVAIAPDAAEALVAAGVRLVGVDYLSVEPFESEDFATHRLLLGAEVVIVEGLDLRAAEPGSYEMACLPMKLAGADGAPARVVLWTDG